MGWIEVLLLLLIGAWILSAVILSWVPPVSKDALVQHLAIPKLYLKHGGIYEIPTMPYSYYPMNLELLYMIPLWLGSDIAAKFIHFAFGLLTAMILFQYLKRRLNIRYALFGCLFFLTLPVIVKLSITVYVDLGVIFFSTGALLLILRWVEKDFKPKYLILSGISCGLAMGCKYNGLVTCAILALFVPFLWGRYGKAKATSFFRPVSYGILFLFMAFLVWSPWMIRNCLWKHNPVYPLYEGWFKKNIAANDVVSRGKKTAFTRTTGTSLFTYRRRVYGESWWEIALLPVRIFFQGQDGNPRLFDGKLNPFLLLLSIFAFYPRRRGPPDVRRERNVLLAYAVLFFLFAFFTSVLRIRYIAPIIPPLIILSAFGLKNLMQTAWKVKGPVTGVMAHGIVLLLPAFALALNAHYVAGQFEEVKPFSYILGKVDRDQYISEYRREYPALQYANRHVPRNAKILFVFLGKRGYYCDRDYVPDTVGQVRSLYNTIRTAKGPQDIWASLRERGITHLIVDLPIFDKWLRGLFDAEAQDRAREFFKKYLIPMYLKNGVAVYQLVGAPEE